MRLSTSAIHLLIYCLEEYWTFTCKNPEYEHIFKKDHSAAITCSIIDTKIVLLLGVV